MRRFLRYLGSLLILLVILAYVPIVVPKLMGLKSFNVISGSMEPTIHVGSIVYVKPAEFEEIEEGAIIAFNSGASVVTHRVVEVDKDSKLITTKGDANEVDDFTPVAYTNVIGVVRYYFPFMGNIASFISDKVGKAVSIIILLFAFVLSSIDDKKKEKEAREEGGQKKKAGFNPKFILVLGLALVASSMIGFFFIYQDYHKGTVLYTALTSEYTQVEPVATEWYDMIDVDIASLQSINPDVVGWIYVEGTDISYPILYSGDDEAYLRTTIDHQYATAGSIFLEGYNLPDFSDSHNIIYGHNMRNLSMFGTLKYYKSEDDYLQEHKYFQIITAEGKTRYEIFSYFDTEPADWVYAVPYSDSEEFGQYISQLISHSYKTIDTAKQVTSSDKITTLSTCSSSGMRFTVHGYLCDTH